MASSSRRSFLSGLLAACAGLFGASAARPAATSGTAGPTATSGRHGRACRVQVTLIDHGGAVQVQAFTWHVCDSHRLPG